MITTRRSRRALWSTVKMSGVLTSSVVLASAASHSSTRLVSYGIIEDVRMILTTRRLWSLIS
jgi:hypothetical protein